MNSALVRLELRKNSLAAASLVAAFLVTLPVSRLVAATTGLSADKALEAIIVGWLLLGLPFCAALIGSVCGAQSASPAARAAEALLPASPRRRAWASLAAALLLLAAVALFMIATTRLCGFAASRWLQKPVPGESFAWGTGGWDLLPRTPLAILALLDALAACWVLAYLIGHGVAGGLLGALLTAASLAAVAAGYALDLFFATRDWHPGFSEHVPALLALALLSKLAAAGGAAAWRERRPRLGAAGAAALAAALLAGPAASWAAVAWTLRGLNGRMHPAEYPRSSAQSWPADKPAEEAAAAAGREAAFVTLRGGLVLAGSAGARIVVPEEKAGMSDFLFRPYEFNVTWNVLRDARGLLWVDRGNWTYGEIWRERPDGSVAERRFTNYYSFYLLKRGARVIVVDARDLRRERYADADDFMLRGTRAAWTSDADALVKREKKSRVADPAALIAGRELHPLRDLSRKWLLPGTPLTDKLVAPYRIGGRPAYLVPVSAGSGAEYALCREDGRVQTAWRLRRDGATSWNADVSALPDGTLYAFGPEDTIGFIDADGAIAAPVSFARLRRDFPDAAETRPALVRRVPDGALLIWARRLFEIDRRGFVRSSRRLPVGVREIHPLIDGFLAVTPSDVYFVDWDGRARRIEKP